MLKRQTLVAFLILALACDSESSDPADTGTSVNDTSVGDTSVDDTGSALNDTGSGGDGASQDAYVNPDAPISDNGLLPRLSNFRVDVANPTRVLFDSSEPIQGGDATGFVISLAEIQSLHINTRQVTGHYVELTEALTYRNVSTSLRQG